MHRRQRPKSRALPQPSFRAWVECRQVHCSQPACQMGRKHSQAQGALDHCIIAQDTPLFHVEPTEVQARRENWLQRHDQSTGGVVGILPLLQNMPIRVTQTLPDLKAFGLFKNTRGTLWNWTLHEADQETVGAVAGQDIVLQRLPRALYVKVEGATWQQHPDLPVGVARIEPVTQTWTLEANGKATVSRRGFPIASDYAGTAHSFMGATLGACTLDLGTWDDNSAGTCACQESAKARICALSNLSPPTCLVTES